MRTDAAVSLCQRRRWRGTGRTRLSRGAARRTHCLAATGGRRRYRARAGSGGMSRASIPHTLIQSPPRDTLARPLHDLRISVIDRCNFRCPYCMPEEQYAQDHVFLAKDERLRFEEIDRIARAFVALGVRKLRLTGGEPLLRRDLPELVCMLAQIPQVEDLALTTNGVLLPRLAPALRAAGLQRLTVSLDTLDPATFRELSGGHGEVG